VNEGRRGDTDLYIANKTKSLYLISAPKDGQAAWLYHRVFPAIGSAGRTVQISDYFAKQLVTFSKINSILKKAPTL